MLRRLTAAFVACIALGIGLPLFGQDDPNRPTFPTEKFIPLNATLSNAELNFEDDRNQSCCKKDYPQGTGLSLRSRAPVPQFPEPDPFYVPKEDPTYLVECAKFVNLSQLAANEDFIPTLKNINPQKPLPLYSFSDNTASERHAHFTNTQSRQKSPTTQFHITTTGGLSLLQLADVSHYSVCMARGGNVAMVANSDNGSIMTYTGNDHIYLAGNNTNMFTRTGAGNDVIEVYQTEALPQKEQADTFRGERWQAHRMFRTALSGSKGNDTLVINNTPAGTKWCFIGGYTIFGEYFYVVEFALPPSVVEGPRRQRLNIGQSVEIIVYRGHKYSLKEFLIHGQPIDAIAKAAPLDAPLPDRLP